MKISIAERLKPFSHKAGATCLIPGTGCQIQAFPTLLRLDAIGDIRIGLSGPIKNFTLEQDLEKNRVAVFGQAREGFFRIYVQGNERGIEFIADKAPQFELAFECVQLNRSYSLSLKERFLLAQNMSFYLPDAWERLSLGMHRKQDWDLVLRRFDLREILPMVMALGQKVPKYSQVGIPMNIIHFLQKGDLEAFCRVGFSGLLVPRIFDHEHQGIILQESDFCNSSEKPSDSQAIAVLQEAARWIRGLFFREQDRCLTLLPAAPFPSGRLIHIQAGQVGEMDIEWASDTLRRAVLRAKSSGECTFSLQPDLRSFRLRTNLSSKGYKHQVGDSLIVEEGKTYFFDQFYR